MPIFRDRFVIFLDILGFAQLVASATRDPSGVEAKKIETALKRVEEISKFETIDQIADLESHIFSDSIVLSVDPAPDTVRWLLIALAASFWDLLCAGVLVRGGASLGKLSTHRDRPWGEALIDAYVVENTLAIYPRVAFGSSALTFLKQHNLLDAEGLFISRDEDGVWSLDILPTNKWISGDDPITIGTLKDDLVEVANHLRSAHSSIIDSPGSYKKVSWFCRTWNTWIQEEMGNGAKPYLVDDD